MKKALLFLACILTMAASMSLKAQEVTIVLSPGWTWISCPMPEAMDFATALGDFTPMQGDIIKSQWGQAIYNGSRWMGTIFQFNPGYGYMYKSNRTMPVMVTFNAQQPIPQVVVTTDAPQLITAVSAMGGGEVTTTDGTYILVKGLCWATHENPTTNEDFFQEAESGVGTFSVSMTGLNISTTYYVRAYAVTPNGTVYGDQKTFTTRDGIPTVTTAEVTDIQGETAICGGNVTDNCGLAVIARGVCWSTSQTPTLDDSYTTNGSGNGSFSSSITGLSISTTYYVRAYATTSAGTGYGEQVSFTTRNGIPTVTTIEVTSIGSGWANSGGNINDDGGLAVAARGVCWSTSPSPTLADAHTSNGNGAGSFSSYITGLSMSTTYYVRAYATNSFVTVYGNQLSFTTTNDEHVYVDLGLPSGLLWATCNVGADSPEDYGDYFAWGETQSKSIYNWSTYQYCNGGDGYNTLTKYCNNSDYGYNGFTDNLTTLLPEDDAATANWGSDWRTPTDEEWQELYQNTTHIYTTQNGVYGRLFTASNGSSLFLPAAGYSQDNGLFDAGNFGDYLSSSLETEFPYYAFKLFFSGEYCEIQYFGDRNWGFNVRPVRSSEQNTAPTGAINGKFTINANGDQVYFSQGNLQYQASTNTWKFADNQYDYIGITNRNISSTYSGWIDLFGWGTSGYNHGANCYQPWSTSANYIDYYAYGNYQYNLYDQTGQADWGYNSISNGGNQANQWRTLTQPEWACVFDTRSTSSGIRYAKAKVNDVNGVILLPDDWNTSIYSLNNSNSSSASYSSNVITVSQWSPMEQAGAIFLPVAGFRNGTSVHFVGSHGYYWSAMCNSGANAYYMYVGDLDLCVDYGTNRNDGFSVRLARVVE